MNKETANDYKGFFIEEIKRWAQEGKIYAITGCIKSEDANKAVMWEGMNRDIISFFNKFQRKLTGARYWKDEHHRQVKVIIFPEGATQLHYHGVILIPRYYFEKKKFDELTLDEFKEKEKEIFDMFEGEHKKQFKGSSKMESIYNIDGWIKYVTKEFKTRNNNFSFLNFMILP